MLTKEVIHVDPYTFVIQENKIMTNQKVEQHTFKIGGKYDRCVTITCKYDKTSNSSVPLSGYISFIEYEPECSLGTPLKKRGGTALMLKVILLYIHQKYPSITKFTLEDYSNIDCEEMDLTKSLPRKTIKPLNLAFFSIVYHSATWYEKHFDAKMEDNHRYQSYKKALEFLVDAKEKMPFVTFCNISRISSDQKTVLMPMYESTSTYREFFNKIPQKQRCLLLYPWLNNFVNHYIEDVYNNKWVIDITSSKIDFSQIVGKKGGAKSNKRTKDPSLFYSVYHQKPIHRVG